MNRTWFAEVDVSLELMRDGAALCQWLDPDAFSPEGAGHSEILRLKILPPRDPGSVRILIFGREMGTTTGEIES